MIDLWGEWAWDLENCAKRLLLLALSLQKARGDCSTHATYKNSFIFILCAGFDFGFSFFMDFPHMPKSTQLSLHATDTTHTHTHTLTRIYALYGEDHTDA